MSHTFTEQTYTLGTTGSGTLSFHTGYKPEWIKVTNSDNVESTWYRVDPGNTRIRAAAGTSSTVTSNGISFNETTNTVTLGSNAALNGTAAKQLFVTVYK